MFWPFTLLLFCPDSFVCRSFVKEENSKPIEDTQQFPSMEESHKEICPETVQDESAAQVVCASIQTLPQCSQEKRMDMEREID